MKIQIFQTLQNYKKEYLPKDILAGIVVAAMSVPISMGYAEIAGLPAVYGLYASIVSILFFSLFTTSGQFIFGVDATPAVMVGDMLILEGIAKGSEEAMRIVPVVALMTGLWLLLFSVLRAGKILSYISIPVMGGFISGIAVTIILMLVPKILGQGSGNGELLELSHQIFEALLVVNIPSMILGAVTLIILFAGKKWIPKVPMAVIVMILAVALEKWGHLSQYGVKLLAAVEPGFVTFVLPDFSAAFNSQILVTSLSIAVVVMAQSLLAEHNFAFKNQYQIQDNREIFSFAIANISSAFCGACPVNGSVSRTSMGELYGGRTQMMSIVSALILTLLLLFGTGFIGYLPVPVLTAIVIFALSGVVEAKLAKRLYRVNRVEFLIFMGAFFGVLLLGTIYGVVIGIVLSFVNVVLRAAKPYRAFLGIIPGHEGFYDLERNTHAKPVRNTVIYKFSGNLFFANINTFIQDLEKSLTDDVTCIIVDASGINTIDITAADYIKTFDQSLRKRHIKFYITEHTAEVNDQMRKLGLGDLIEKGMVRRTITTALHEIGYQKPFPLKDVDDELLLQLQLSDGEEQDSLQEFFWAFGRDAAKQMEKNVERILNSINMEDFRRVSEENLGTFTHLWKKLSTFDEDELLERLEMHSQEISQKLSISEKEIIQRIEMRRREIQKNLRRENPTAYEQLHNYENQLEKELKKEYPEEFKHMEELREKEGNTWEKIEQCQMEH